MICLSPPRWQLYTPLNSYLLELRDCAQAWGPCLQSPSLPPVGPDWAALVGDLELEAEF